MVPGMGPSFPAGFLFLALEDLFLLMEQVNTKSQAPGRINDENVNHTPTRKTGVSPTLDLRHTFLYLTLKQCRNISIKKVGRAHEVSQRPRYGSSNLL